MTHLLHKPSEIDDGMTLGGISLMGLGFVFTFHPAYKVTRIMQIQNVYPAALENSIKLTGLMDGYSFLKNRDGVNSLWNGVFFGAIYATIEFCDEEMKKEVFKLEKYIPKEEYEPTPERKLRHFKGNLFYGLAIGVTFYPFYNLWVRMCTDISPVPIYANSLDCVTKVWENEGFKGFYKGFSWYLVKTILKAFFETYNYIHRTKDSFGCAKNNKYYALNGLQSVFRFPLETLVVRSILGLPLLLAGASTVDTVADLYSGFSIEMISVITENLCVFGFTMLSKMLENKLPY
jgi:Mitochondrial carrier protein